MSYFFNQSMQFVALYEFVIAITLGIVIAVAACVSVFYLGKLIWLICKGIGKLFKKIFKTPKQKCAEIQCPFCGKMLDRCSCQKNNARTYRQRLRSYKKWYKQHHCCHKDEKK